MLIFFTNALVHKVPQGPSILAWWINAFGRSCGENGAGWEGSQNRNSQWGQSGRVAKREIVCLGIWGQGSLCNSVLFNLWLEHLINLAICTLLCYKYISARVSATRHWVKEMGSSVSNSGTSYLLSQSIHFYHWSSDTSVTGLLGLKVNII